MSVNVNGIVLNVPNSHAGVLPVEEHPHRFAFEPLPWFALGFFTQPNTIVFDVGASFGVITALLAKRVGSNGRVHSFEANHGVLSLAKNLASENDLLGRVTFVNACIGDKTGPEVEFFVVPGYESVASSLSDGIAKVRPDVQVVRVPMLSLDDHCKKFQVFPSCMKLDIEGAEYIALRGANRLITAHHPDLVVETHGRAVDTIGGSVEALCQDLEAAGYGLFDLKTGRAMSAAEYSELHSTDNGHLVASTRLRDPRVVDQFRGAFEAELQELETLSRTAENLTRARQLVNDGQTSQAVPLLRNLLGIIPDDAEVNYLAAYCLHVTGTDRYTALRHYTRALELGFSEFWVRYNRGALYLQMGNPQEAGADLTRAAEVDPNHPGVQQYLGQLPKR